MFCQNCGNKLNESSNFCPDCGTYTSNTNQANTNSSKPVRPKNYLLWAILSTIFGCLPFGIVSIVYSIQVNEYYDSGDYPNAVRASRDAKKWVLAGFWFLVLSMAIPFFLIIASLLGLASFGLLGL